MKRRAPAKWAKIAASPMARRKKIQHSQVCVPHAHVQVESRPEDSSLRATINRAYRWVEFAAKLATLEKKAVDEAAAMGPILAETGGCTDLFTPGEISEVLCNWARAVSPEHSANMSEADREKLTDRLWAILEAGGARKYINQPAITACRGNFHPPLHVACGFESSRAIQILLSCPEIDVNSRAHPNGVTPAMHCLLYMKGGTGFEQLFATRLLDLDLDLKAADGLNLADKVRAAVDYASDVGMIRKRATWIGSMHWLRNYYFPNVHRSLDIGTRLPNPLIQIIDSFIRPRSLPSTD